MAAAAVGWAEHRSTYHPPMHICMQNRYPAISTCGCTAPACPSNRCFSNSSSCSLAAVAQAAAAQATEAQLCCSPAAARPRVRDSSKPYRTQPVHSQ
jgi:hypothetical protein